MLKLSELASASSEDSITTAAVAVEVGTTTEDVGITLSSTSSIPG
jgi:hypothetical protein